MMSEFICMSKSGLETTKLKPYQRKTTKTEATPLQNLHNQQTVIATGVGFYSHQSDQR